MATFYYNAKAEAHRKSLLRSQKPTIGLPSNVFPVRTDDGDEIHLSTAIFTESATIVVTTLDCKVGEKFTYSVLVTNGKAPGMSSATAGYAKDAAKQVAGNAAKVAAGATAVGKFVRGQAAGFAAGAVVGGLLGADKTGMGASIYHTVREIRSAAGRLVEVYIGGEKP